MAGSDSSQKTEKPTPKRLREARRRGQIPRSPDLVGWLALLLASYVIPYMLGRLRTEFFDYFAGVVDAVRADDLARALSRPEGLVLGVALVLIPFLVFVAVIIAAGLVAQGGVTLTAEPLRPKMERISPKAGLKRLVSPQSAVDTAKALFRLVVLSVLVFQIMSSELRDHLSGSPRPLSSAGPELGAALLLLVRLSALIGLAVGIGDYAFQRWKVARQLRMTKDEIRREAKNTDGDPMLRGRRRAMHQKVSQNKMLAAVSDASVVVVNPTHVSVALAYQAGGVPRVVAKGTDTLALRIRERAFDEGVPVVECRPLARVLNDLLEVGAEVPATLYEAVAIVIAFVMRLPPTAVSKAVRRVNVPSSKLDAARAEAAGTAGSGAGAGAAGPDGAARVG